MGIGCPRYTDSPWNTGCACGWPWAEDVNGWCHEGQLHNRLTTSALETRFKPWVVYLVCGKKLLL